MRAYSALFDKRHSTGKASNVFGLVENISSQATPAAKLGQKLYYRWLPRPEAPNTAAKDVLESHAFYPYLFLRAHFSKRPMILYSAYIFAVHSRVRRMGTSEGLDRRQLSRNHHVQTLLHGPPKARGV
jgi:hypothetical protein